VGDKSRSFAGKYQLQAYPTPALLGPRQLLASLFGLALLFKFTRSSTEAAGRPSVV